jgi:hypothetical protein
MRSTCRDQPDDPEHGVDDDERKKLPAECLLLLEPSDRQLAQFLV